MEQLTKKGYEVLFMIDPIDEVAMQNLTQYKEKKLVDISKEDLDLGEEDEDEKKKSAEIEEEYKPLTDWILETLGADKVEKVAVSKRLTDTPCILVTSKFGWSANMERIMKAQAMGDNRAQEYMKGKKTMEINPTSPVILDLKAKQAAGDVSFYLDDRVWANRLTLFFFHRIEPRPQLSSSSTPRCSRPVRVPTRSPVTVLKYPITTQLLTDRPYSSIRRRFQHRRTRGVRV